MNDEQRSQLQTNGFQHLHSLFQLLMVIPLNSSHAESPPHLFQEHSGECWSVSQNLWLLMGEVACFSVVLFPRNAVSWACSGCNPILLGGIC